MEEARSELERAYNLNLASTVCSRWERTHNLEVFVSYLSAGTSGIRIKRQFKIWINWREEGNKTIIGNDDDRPHILNESDYHRNLMRARVRQKNWLYFWWSNHDQMSSHSWRMKKGSSPWWKWWGPLSTHIVNESESETKELALLLMIPNQHPGRQEACLLHKRPPGESTNT